MFKFVVLLLAFALVHAKQNLNAEERACAEKTGFSIKAAEKMSEDLMVPENEPHLKKFLHCVYKHYGMITDDHKIDFDVLKTEMLKSYSADSVNSLIDACKDTTLTDDDSENAYLVTKCMCDTLHPHKH